MFDSPLLIVNVLFSLGMALWDLKARRVLTMFWLLSIYFSMLIMIDIIHAPVFYPLGFIVGTVDKEMIISIIPFIFKCNVSFAIAEQLIFLILRDKPFRLFPLKPHDPPVKFLTYLLFAFFLVGAAFYFKQIYGFSYSDFVSYTGSSWKGLLFAISMPLAVILILQRKYFYASIPVMFCLALVVMMKVRVFVLYSVFPVLITFAFLFMQSTYDIKHKFKMMVLMGLLAIGVGAGGSMVMYMRTEKFELPETILPHGMYLTFIQVDRGVPKTGFDSLELAVKSMLYPVYNRFLSTEYELPEDPAEYIAELVTGRYNTFEGYRHFPFLWYTDAYLGLGRHGWIYGLIWGSILAMFEGLMRKNILLWCLFLPYFIWIIYLTVRGAPGHAFYVANRNLYIEFFIFLFVQLRYGSVQKPISLIPITPPPSLYRWTQRSRKPPLHSEALE